MGLSYKTSANGPKVLCRITTIGHSRTGTVLVKINIYTQKAASHYRDIMVVQKTWLYAGNPNVYGIIIP